jgi:cobalt-zinc-cadmium efflux system outer membrane protein
MIVESPTVFYVDAHCMVASLCPRAVLTCCAIVILLFQAATAQAVAMRVSAGEDSLFEGSLAEVDAGRARNEVALLRERLTQARPALAAILQLRVERLPKARGLLGSTPIDYTLRTLLDSAADRPGLRALGHRVEAATSRLGARVCALYPDVTVSLSRAREGDIGGDDEIIGVGVSVSIPLFCRNTADIGRAPMQLMHARIERHRVTRNVRARVIALWRQLKSCACAAKLDQAVLPPLRENLR